MNIKSLLLAIICVAGFALSANAQQQKHLSFNAVAQNVDGLPKTISGVSVNEDGQEGPGATALGNAIIKQSWDIVGMSEDFNFHSELTAPFSGLYQVGTHGGTVDAGAILGGADTDGLGLLLANRAGASFANETRVTWTTYNGFTDQGADGLVSKGFRYYAVTLGEGFVVDVYVLHMDADSGEKDIAARTTQLKQLAAYIKEHNNKRPIIIIGDTNCRYTRDSLQEDLINSINNAGNGMTIKDAWIELVRAGNYPLLGSDALMIDALGPRKGEVVDKIFYINIEGAPVQISANTYDQIQPDGWPSDHWPVIVNFTLTNAEGTDTAGENKWTVDAPSAVLAEVQGCEVATGTTYYIKNVGSKKYLKSGANWGTRATEGSAGMPVSLELIDGKYKIKTFGNRSMTAEATPYMDNANQNNGWTFEKVEGTEYQYYLTCSAGALYSTGEEGNVVNCTTIDRANNNFKWVLLDDAKMKEEMQKTTTEFDCTPLIKAADFDFLDFPVGENDNADNMANWSGYSGYTNQFVKDGAPGTYATCAVYNGTDEKTISQTLTAMPKGTYKVSFQGFYRYMYNASWIGGSVKDYTFDAKVTFGSGSGTVQQNTNDDIGSTGMETKFKDGSSYLTEFTTTLDSESDLTMSVIKPVCSGRKSNSSWIVIDNIKILYQGNGETETDPTLEHKIKVANKINATWEEVAQLDVAGQNVYDISLVLYRYNNGLIKTEADATAACAMIDAAYATAVIANNAAIVENAAQNGGGDVSALIVNASFETGDLTGWTIKSATADTGVYPNSNGTYTTYGIDGTYLFNSWDGDANSTASYVKQEIVGLKNGLYELRAKLASFDNHTSYLIGNNSHAAVKSSAGKTQFDEVSLLFLVEDGTATIGAVGASAINNDFSYYHPANGGFLKADDFRLAYVCDVAYGRLQLAIDKAASEAEKLDEYGIAAFDISAYEAMFAEKTLSSDGIAESQAVYAALTAAVKAQKTADADMTYAITNPNFEEGTMNGWTTTTAWETFVSNLDRTATVGYDGVFLFNTWDPSATLKPISQTVTGIPNGTYRLTAMMTSGTGNNLYVAGNGTYGEALIANDAFMAEASTEFEVTDGTAVISAFGGNADGTVDVENGGCWYKVDNFRLAYLGREIVLDDTATVAPESGFYTKVSFNRSFQDGQWTTLVLPFATAVPENLIAKKFETDELADSVVTLRFSDATVFEAGVPYMVQPAGEDEVVFNPVMTNVELDMDTPALELTNIVVQGTYVAENVPQNAYFIANNEYICAETETDTINGYNVYIVIKDGVGVKHVRYSFSDEEEDEGDNEGGNEGDGEGDGNIDEGGDTEDNEDGDATDIDNADKEVAKVIAVFSIDGRPLNALQRGYNIVKMSDGGIKKVFVK